MHFYLLAKQLLLDILSKSFEKVSKFEKSSAFVTILVKEEEENMADKEEESLILNLHKYLLLNFIQGT